MVNKKPKTWRLSEAMLQAVNEFQQKNSLRYQNQALEQMILRLKYLEDLALETNQLNQQEIACISRIKYQGIFWCVYRPPRMKELETLDICGVCKKRRLGLNEKSLLSPATAKDGIFIPQTEPPLAQDPAPIRDPNKKHEGMKYCGNVGNWVFPRRCELCKEKTYAQYDNCQKQKAV